jgi:hypothetical protein
MRVEHPLLRIGEWDGFLRLNQWAPAGDVLNQIFFFFIRYSLYLTLIALAWFFYLRIHSTTHSTSRMNLVWLTEVQFT